LREIEGCLRGGQSELADDILDRVHRR
jgi:hypothetical protein